MGHMNKLVAILDTHLGGTKKWKSMVGSKTKEKLMSTIIRFGLIAIMSYFGGEGKIEAFKVFIGEVYVVADINQHCCTCMA